MANSMGGPLLKIAGAIAGAGINGSTAQYKFVKFSADLTVVLCSATTDIPCGVLQEPAVSGDAADVAFFGETILQAGGSLTAGNVIGTNASGQAQAAVSTQYVVGQVVNVASATSAGNEITALINCANPPIKA